MNGQFEIHMNGMGMIFAVLLLLLAVIIWAHQENIIDALRAKPKKTIAMKVKERFDRGYKYYYEFIPKLDKHGHILNRLRSVSPEGVISTILFSDGSQIIEKAAKSGMSLEIKWADPLIANESNGGKTKQAAS